MNKKILVIFTGLLAVYSARVQAQGVVFVAEDAPYSHPEVLVHIPPAGQDNVIVQNTSFSENDTNTQNTNENSNISYYVQKLNLSPEQITQAQEISSKAHAKQEQILLSIEDLRQQAHELEQRSLADFEAILTDEQKTLFAQLRNEHDNGNSLNDIQPEIVQTQQPETMNEAQPEIQPETISEPQPESTPEFHPAEPQPEAGATPQQASVSEPQPEVQQEAVTEAQPEAVSESQPEIQE